MKPRQNDGSQPPREPSKRARVWAWLGDSANQKTLRFLGAAVAAAVALLATAGLVNGPDKGAAEKAEQAEKAEKAAGTSRPTPRENAPVDRQEAAAGDHGVAANVHGNGNAINFGGKP
jgi:hypothetical protein